MAGAGAILALSLLCLAAPAAAQDASLIRLESRVLDVGVEAIGIRRAPSFIPITEADSVKALTTKDPHSLSAEIAIRSSDPEKMDWHLHERELVDSAGHLAEKWIWRPATFAVWPHRKKQMKCPCSFFPESSDADFYAARGCDRGDPLPGRCRLRVLYPADPDLMLNLAVSPITDPFNDFEAIAKRAQALVSCLEVISEVRRGSSSPLTSGTDATVFEAVCASRIP